jgi:hypothetical protein
MPVVLRVKGYKFWFYEADLAEAPHVHAGKGGKVAKYWLEPVRMARAGGFRPVDLREIEGIILESQQFLQEAWRDEERKRADRQGKSHTTD